MLFWNRIFILICIVFDSSVWGGDVTGQVDPLSNFKVEFGILGASEIGGDTIEERKETLTEIMLKYGLRDSSRQFSIEEYLDGASPEDIASHLQDAMNMTRKLETDLGQLNIIFANYGAVAVDPDQVAALRKDLEEAKKERDEFYVPPGLMEKAKGLLSNVKSLDQMLHELEQCNH